MGNTTDSKKVKNDSDKTIRTTAVVKRKRHMPARIIKEAEIVAQPKKAPKIISKKSSNATETKQPSKKNNSPNQKRIIHRIEVVEHKSSSAATSSAKNIKSTAKPTEKAPKEKKNMKLPLIRRLHIKIRYIVAGAIVVLLAVFFGRVALWEHNYILAMEGTERHTVKTEESTEPNGVYEGGETVDEEKPTEVQIKEHIVAPEKPRYLTINSLGIYTAPIVEVGLSNGGELGTPNRAWYVGWYTGSALPGDNGVTMLDAHGGALGNGVFKYLPRITVGADIVVEMGDGRKYTYTVVDKATRDIGEAANSYMNTAFSSPQTGVPSMTLITCTGEWSDRQQTYLQRLFVRAVLKR